MTKKWSKSFTLTRKNVFFFDLPLFWGVNLIFGQVWWFGDAILELFRLNLESLGGHFWMICLVLR